MSAVVTDFHKAFYDAAKEGGTWNAATYFGVKLWKSPIDLQLYQELIYELKPQLIIETGTNNGGSALYFAHLLDHLSAGKVVTIDIQPFKQEYPRHSRITYLSDRSSTDHRVIREVRSLFEFTGGPTLVVLDSDHSKEHVGKELNAYLPFVRAGSWLVVEDTNINGNPVLPEFGDGPREALEEWLPIYPDFRIDQRRQDRYLFSFHTWLRRMRV